MSERKRNNPNSEHMDEHALAAEEDAAADAAREDEIGFDTSELDDAEPDVQDLEAEAASLKDQLLRALAETENLRRRSQREREDVIKYAAAPLIKDLIGVSDNLRRALDAVPPEAVEGNEQLQNLLAGVEMTAKELGTLFERHNVVKIDPMGEPLNPHFHEALFEVPDPEKPSGTVVQVVQAGYRLHDRLLRAAQVAVSKGGPAPARAKAGPVAEEPPSGDGASGEDTAGDDNETPPGSRIDTQA